MGPPALRLMVEQAGYPFSAGGEPPDADVAAIRDRLPLVPRAEASALANRELFGRMATDAMLPGMREVMTRWSPDLVLREPCEYASAVVAREVTVRTAQVAISSARAELGSIATAAPALEAHRGGLAHELVTMPYLTRFPASFDRSGFPSTERYHTESPDPHPLPDWWHGSDAPLVYVTFGTVLGRMPIAADVVNTVMRAVSGIVDARVLLTVGHGFDPSGIAPLPANTRLEPWVEQADVFAQADVVLRHGGSGTVFGALAAGVPLVVVPVFADQFDNGRRVSRTGVGLTCETGPGRHDSPRPLIGDDDVDRIAQAVRTVLAEPDFRRRAERTAGEMAAAPSVDEILTALSGQAR